MQVNQHFSPRNTMKLIIAATEGDLQTVQEEIQRGANVDLMSNEGNTALMYASNCGHLQCVLELIASECDLNLQSRTSECTAAMCASLSGREACLRELISAGCNLDLRNYIGDTVWDRSDNLIRQILREQSAAKDAIYQTLRNNHNFSDAMIEQICNFTLRKHN